MDCTSEVEINSFIRNEPSYRMEGKFIVFVINLSVKLRLLCHSCLFPRPHMFCFDSQRVIRKECKISLLMYINPDYLLPFILR